MEYFLHDSCGYDMLSIPKLHAAEIRRLIEGSRVSSQADGRSGQGGTGGITDADDTPGNMPSGEQSRTEYHSNPIAAEQRDRKQRAKHNAIAEYRQQRGETSGKG